MSNGWRNDSLMPALWAAQRKLCFHCAEPMNWTGPSYADRKVSREHLFPKSTTGRGLFNNIVLAHRSCNTARGAREPTHEEIARAIDLYAEIGERPFIRFEELISPGAAEHLAILGIDVTPLVTIGDIWPSR